MWSLHKYKVLDAPYKSYQETTLHRRRSAFITASVKQVLTLTICFELEVDAGSWFNRLTTNSVLSGLLYKDSRILLKHLHNKSLDRQVLIVKNNSSTMSLSCLHANEPTLMTSVYLPSSALSPSATTLSNLSEGGHAGWALTTLERFTARFWYPS